jgi:hypothetical protein
MARVNFAGYKIGVRMGMGVILVLGGIFGFLPVLGFWMIPLGLAILAVDFPPVRRLQRRLTVRLGNWLHRSWPNVARRFGYGQPREQRKR